VCFAGVVDGLADSRLSSLLIAGMFDVRDTSGDKLAQELGPNTRSYHDDGNIATDEW
jgi:hypothetical protein